MLLPTHISPNLWHFPAGALGFCEAACGASDLSGPASVGPAPAATIHNATTKTIAAVPRDAEKRLLRVNIRFLSLQCEPNGLIVISRLAVGELQQGFTTGETGSICDAITMPSFSGAAVTVGERSDAGGG